MIWIQPLKVAMPIAQLFVIWKLLYVFFPIDNTYFHDISSHARPCLAEITKRLKENSSENIASFVARALAARIFLRDMDMVILKERF